VSPTTISESSKNLLNQAVLEFYEESARSQTVDDLTRIFEHAVSSAIQVVFARADCYPLPVPKAGNPSLLEENRFPRIDICFCCPLQVDRISRIETLLSGEPLTRHDLSGSDHLPQDLQSHLDKIAAFFDFMAEAFQRRLIENEQNIRDPLTGLYNRRYFQLALEQWATDGRRFDLVLFGLNRFKRVNESLGHPAGDQILEIVANQLSEIVEQGDVLARIGGDEFAILACRDKRGDATFDPDSVHARLAEGFEYQGERLRCYTSIGVSRFPEHGSDHSELLRYADHAMIKAKHFHTGTVWYDGDVPRDAVKLLALETRIESAIDKDEFTLAVQPIYDLTSGTGKIAELEILLRWSPENIGPVSPEIFVSIAERMGLSAKLDRYVIRKALRETAHLTMPIAVNLTAPTLYADDFVAFVSSELSKAGRMASRFGVEITERVIAQPSAARQSLDALGNLGVHIAIDDFGVGYSSLSVLPELPLSRLKIDKKFLIEKDANPRFEEVIVGILRMASSLGLESLIEGVEDASIQEWLCDVGCDFAQGFGLGRPGTISDISQSHEVF